MNNPTTPMDKLGTPRATERGFPHLEFQDQYETECSLQASSVVLDYDDSMERPGSSAVWLGVSTVKPMVMASKAASVGVSTEQTTGWVPYPVPPQVILNSRMHLNREQVAGLIERLQEWLDKGKWD
jgi:hypothetical protein